MAALYKGKKTIKSQVKYIRPQPPRLDLVGEPIAPWAGVEEITVASFDPGSTNFGFNIERYNRATNVVTPLIYERISLRTKTEPEELTFIRFLQRYNTPTVTELLQQCHLCITEIPAPENYAMIEMAQHVNTFLMMVLVNSKVGGWILKVNGKLKTKPLGVPKGMDKTATKAWTIAFVQKVLEAREDGFRLAIRAGDKPTGQKTKLEDLSDLVALVEGCLVYLGLKSLEQVVAPKQPVFNLTPIGATSSTAIFNLTPVTATFRLEPISTGVQRL